MKFQSIRPAAQGRERELITELKTLACTQVVNAMNEEPAKQEKEELIRLILDAKSAAKKLEGLGQGLVKSARLIQDVADPAAELFSQVAPDQLTRNHWNHQIEAWRDIHDAAGR